MRSNFCLPHEHGFNSDSSLMDQFGKMLQEKSFSENAFSMHGIGWKEFSALLEG
jgi:hypothetical protein